VCPSRYSASVLLSSNGLAQRARERWRVAGRAPITRLDAAGVSPKVASVLMGHAVPQRQPGAAQVKLARYTHALPEDVERARRQLADYLAATQAQKAARRRVGPYLGPSAGPRRGFSC
jgi:hypothetical protein